MQKYEEIYRDADYFWAIIARDPDRPEFLIDTNEFIVGCGDDAILLDPGGSEIFPVVFSAISEAIDPRIIQRLFSSHQDPDIISSLSLWLDFNPQIKCYVSTLWAAFIPHFGGNAGTFIVVPDEGLSIQLGERKLAIIPAHYLHSSGNFNLYDPVAKILFSGDIGAALLPPSESAFFVKDFDSHIQFAEGFHRRWMGSNEAKTDWINRMRKLEIDMICPQHGSIYQGENVGRFLDWFDRLDVGSGIR